MWTVYATSTCQYCKQLQEFLTERGEEVDYVVLSAATLPRYLEDFPNEKTVPQTITPDGNKLSGFDAVAALFK